MSSEAQQNSTVQERHNPFAKHHEPIPDVKQESTEEVHQPGQDQVVQQYQPEPQVFYKIVDIITEYQRGNFLPALHCLRYGMVPKDYVDYSGYNFVHHAVSQGAIPILLILLDHFRIDVNIRSSSGQTALMIACHYGHIEIVKLLCERGAQINCQDNTKFNALLYCVKQNYIPHAAYLLQQEADIKVSDLNGCTVVHWAAFRNNVFFLKMFKRLGLDMNVLDATGMTPLDRAVQGACHEAIEFLLANCEDKLPASMKFGELPASDIKELIRRKFFPTPMETRREKAKKFFEKNSRTITFSFYALFCFLSINLYVDVIMYKGFGYTGDLIYLLFNLYFIAYTFWYFMKSSKSGSNSSKVFAYKQVANAADESFASSSPGYKLRYTALDKLLRGDSTDSIIDDVESTAFPSFLHELAWHWDQKNFRQIAKFSEREYCATCLQKLPPRSIHPEGSAFCIPQYHHFSPCLNRPVDGNNHFLYFGLLIQQMGLLTMFVLGTWLTLGDDIQNKKIWFLEAAYILASGSLLHGLVYVLALAFAGWNFIFLSIEIYGLLKNVTYSEIFESHKHPELAKIRMNPRGGYGFTFFNPYDHGIFENVKDYFMRIVQATGF